MSSRPKPADILIEACARHGVDWRIADRHGAYLIEISRNGRRFFAGFSTIPYHPLNTAAASQLARDKAYSYAVLEDIGVDVPAWECAFLRDESRTVYGVGHGVAPAMDFASRNGYPVFVKPNQGAKGRGADTANDPDELAAALRRLAQDDYIAIVQEYVVLDEYRVLVMDGRPLFAYRRARASVTGDGRRTVRELVSDQGRRTPETNFLKRRLDEIPGAGERLECAPAYNLDSGGTIAEVFEDVPDRIGSWALGIAERLGLAYCGIDFFCEDLHGGAPKLIEANASPSLVGVWEHGRRDLVFDIWGRIFSRSL